MYLTLDLSWPRPPGGDPRWGQRLASPLQLALDPGLALLQRPGGTEPWARPAEPGAPAPWPGALGGLPALLPAPGRLTTPPDLLDLSEARSAQAPLLGRPPMPADTTWSDLPLSDRGRHDAPLEAPLDPAEQGPPPEPRAFVLGGEVSPALAWETLQSLAAREVLPPEPGVRGRHLQVHLGSGEGIFLHGQSALWAWRPYRAPGLVLHTLGPPVPGRDLLMEQRSGLITVLQGCRILSITEQPRRWGFTLASVDEQVFRLREELLVAWEDDDQVWLHIRSQWQLNVEGAMTVFGAGLLNMRRQALQHYVRSMRDLAQL